MNNGKALVARLRDSVRAPALLIALVATFLLGWFLWRDGADLRDAAAAPCGIVSLEVAGTAKGAQAIVDSWKNAHPVRQILWDFPFIVAYAYSLFALGTFAARYANYRGRPGLARIAGWAALAGLFAGACDVFEDFGMLWTIGNGARWPVPFLTSLFATAKFSLIGVALVVSLSASVLALLWPSRLRLSH
jgi:hypothetical protein